MFKYNELSDLLNGSLVTPLSKTDDGLIRCIDNEGNECFYEFDDFDFDKLPSERIVEDVIVEPEKPEEEIITEPEEPEEEIVEPPTEEDDSIFDGTDDTPEPIYDEETGEEIILEDERFLTKDEAQEIVKKFGVETPVRKIWRDII